MKRKLLILGAILLVLSLITFGLYYAKPEIFSEIATKQITDQYADSGDLKVQLETEQEYQIEILALPALDNSDYQVYVEYDPTEQVIFERQGQWTENSTLRFETTNSGSYQIKWSKLRVSQIIASEVNPLIPETSLLIIAVILLSAGLASIILDFKNN